MAMSGEIRVRTSEKYRDIYNDLKNVVIRDFHELFFVCACVGYTRKRKTALGKSKEDRFWSKTITPDEWACYYAMVLKDNNMNFKSIASDADAEVIACIEEYANSGMEILLDEVLQDYLVRGSQEPRIDTSALDSLPREFLFFLKDSLAGAGI